ncbi:hypothetical protein [Geochorda subterranea]|uniref:Uncharacterized protein n=1 Tax=Geochorda subterranea TaxID=3109564 RepID=A0ABZ1BPW4_9FIRM|nr:hypothetical protein [Limnochorda sp. LNt]WRP14503.1 hypothetical protein VLY81_13960 [Limnochorda sp. LNt]
MVRFFDLTPEQLERDRETARRFGLHEGDRGDPEAPPGSWEHLRSFFPPLLAIKARRVHPR